MNGSESGPLVEYVFFRMVLTEGRRDEWCGSYDKRYILQ